MFKRIFGLIAVMSLVLTFNLQAQENEKTLELSLKDCILKAMKNNLGLAIDVLNPELADISVSVANEKFLPNLSFNYSKRDTNQASFSFLDAADQVASLTDNYSARISQLIPTGASLSVSLDGYKTSSNRSFQSINPRYGSTLTFDFTQPLLKDFGFKTNRREIIVAQNNLEISEFDLERSLQNTVYDVEEAYWNLVYSIENLKVMQRSLELAQDLLEKNKRAVEIGTLAPIEILNAQASVATREADILEAEALVKNNEDFLKTTINLASELEGSDLMKIIPVDTPAYEQSKITLDNALSTALENRPDLNATRADLKNKEINVGYNKNQLLPDLSFQASYWSPGITGNQILYLNDNAFTGVVVGTIPGSPADALKDAFNFKYKNWSVGLTLTIPVKNIFSRAAYAQARVNRDQALLQIKNQEQQIYLEIKNAVRAVQTNYKRAQSYKVARELEEKKLEAEEEKFKVGLTTNYFVLQYQRDLAAAQTTELKAVIDYNLSLANLDRALGLNLDTKNIKISQLMKK